MVGNTLAICLLRLVTSTLIGWSLVLGVIFRPRFTFRLIVDRSPSTTATLIWFAAWILPLILWDWVHPRFANEWLRLLAQGLVVVPAFAILNAASWWLHLAVDKRYTRYQMIAILGYAAVPHLLVACALVYVVPERSHLPIASGFPGGVGLAGFSIPLFLDIFWGIEVTMEPFSFPFSLLYIPFALTVWSGALLTAAMRYMGSNWVRAFMFWGFMVVFLAGFSTFAGVFIPWRFSGN